jgi:hypothetical protein
VGIAMTVRAGFVVRRQIRRPRIHALGRSPVGRNL